MREAGARGSSTQDLWISFPPEDLHLWLTVTSHAASESRTCHSLGDWSPYASCPHQLISHAARFVAGNVKARQPKAAHARPGADRRRHAANTVEVLSANVVQKKENMSAVVSATAPACTAVSGKTVSPRRASARAAAPRRKLAGIFTSASHKKNTAPTIARDDVEVTFG